MVFWLFSLCNIERSFYFFQIERKMGILGVKKGLKLGILGIWG